MTMRGSNYGLGEKSGIGLSAAEAGLEPKSLPSQPGSFSTGKLPAACTLPSITQVKIQGHLNFVIGGPPSTEGCVFLNGSSKRGNLVVPDPPLWASSSLEAGFLTLFFPSARLKWQKRLMNRHGFKSWFYCFPNM